MLSNLSNNNSGNKTKSVVEKKHYEEIENRLDEMQTEIDANSSAIAQNASDIETLDDRIDAVEENSTFESINTDTIYPATGQTVTLDGDALVTGTLAAHDINTNELTVNGVSFDDVVDNSVTALTNSRAANYIANQARTKANQVDLRVDNLISSMATELDTDLLKADEGRFDSLTSDVGTIDEIFSHEATTDILNADMVKAVGKLVRPTIGQPYYTIDIPENCITTLKGTFTVDGVVKNLFISSTPGSLYYYQESLEIIKTISFNRATGAARIVLKTDNDFDYISISNGDTVSILDGDNAYANYVFVPEKLRGVITRGFWTNETETVVTGILKAYQLQAENEHFESTSVDDLFIEKSLNVPEQWDQSGIACFSSGLPDQYLSIDTMDGVTHPRWKDSANEATGTLNETNRLVTEESVAKWNGTSCDGTNEYYPITNIGDNAEVHGSATIDEDLAVTCDATVSGDLTVTGLAHLNADSADKLHTARCINGTAFDGTDDITTSKWGTARTITVQDNDGSNSTCTQNVDGSADITLSLPATIKADIDGIACNAKCIEIKADSCNAEYNIPFETTSNATYQELGKDNCLKFNPSTNQLSTDRLCGTECVDTPLLKATQADITCNFTVGKNAVIAGDLTVAGTMHVNETENISTGADIITMRTNNNSSLGTGCVSGLFINKYDGSNSMVLGTDKNGTFRVGDSAGTSTSYAEIYTDDENWYNGTYPNGVQFTFSGSLTSYSSLRIETDTSVTPPKTYKIYDDAVITSVDISDMEPLATRAEASDMQDGYVSVWDSAETDLVTNVNEAKVHGLVSDCKVCGVDFHGTNFCGTDLYGCLHGNVDGDAATASKVATASNTTCATFYPTFVDSNNGTAANESVYTDADLNYNPDTNVLSVPNVNASGKVCGGCFTSDDTATVKIEYNNELNMYPSAGDTIWINYRGGANKVWIGNGNGATEGYGEVKAATFCGDLCGMSEKIKLNTTSTCQDYSMPIVTSCCVFYSNCCAITFNPNTGRLKVCGPVQAAGSVCGNDFVASVCCFNNTFSSTDEVYFYLGKVYGGDNNGTRLTYALSGTGIIDSGEITIINGSNCEPFVEWHQSHSFNAFTGVRGLVVTRDCPQWNCPSCYYLRVAPFAANEGLTTCVRFLTDNMDKTGMGYKALTGTSYQNVAGCSLVNWSSVPTCVSSSVNTTATSCNANYYLTFVNSNNGTATAENVYTNAGLYYNPNGHRLWNVYGSNYSWFDAGLAEFSAPTPAIDFNFNNYTGGYTTRLVDDALGRFSVIVNNGTGTTTATQTATFCYYSSGSLAVPGKVVTPKVEAGGNLTLATDINNTQYCMCLCGANGVLYNPQGYNVPSSHAVGSGDDVMVYGGMVNDNITSVNCLCSYRSLVGTSSIANAWYNVISIRHVNGAGDGTCYGVALYQPARSSSHWCYKQQMSGNWCAENQLIDSTGGQTIAGNLTVHNSSNNAVLCADCFCGCFCGCINFNDVADAYECSVGIGCICRKIYSTNVITNVGFRGRAAIGHYRPYGSGSYWGAALISLGVSDDGTCWVDYSFDENGYTTAPTGYKTSTGLTLTSNGTCPISLTCGSYRIQLTCDDSTLVGCDTSAGQGSTAIGVCTSASGTCATAIGCEACAIGDASVAIGSDAHANSNSSVAVGSLTAACGTCSVAIGYSAYACTCAIAIGCGARAGTSDTIAIGTGACTFAYTYGEAVDCHVVHAKGASAHFCFNCSVTQNIIFGALACRGKTKSPMWPIGCGCTYCGLHMVPARWIWRNGTCSDAGNWLSWDGDGNIDLVGTVRGTDHAIWGTSTTSLGARLEIWADWSFNYCN